MLVASKLSVFLAELKRRKVYHVGVVYLLVGLAVAQGADWAFDLLELPNVASQLIAVLIALGFPIALVLAWAYEVKPEEPRPADSSETGDSKEPSVTDLPSSKPGDHRNSIVVLPFDNMSPDPGDAYFSDGLTEEIITHLSHVHSLRVISRNSAMVLKGTQKDTRTIAEELDVGYVLEGSVRKAGSDLRITAQLINGTSDEHVWAEQYDGVLEDVFRMQEDVAISIVKSLKIQLEPEEARRLSEHPIQDLQAYEYYLRATYEALHFTKEAMDRAMAHLEQALQIVGENGVLLAGMAYLHSQFANIGEDIEASLARAEEYAVRALEMDPGLAQAHMVLGTTRLIQRRTREGVYHYEKALESNPHDSMTLIWASVGYSLVGNSAGFRRSVEQALKVDPLTPIVQSLPGFLGIMEGRFDEGARYYEKLDAADPGNPMGIFLRVLGLAWGQRLDEARSVITEKVPENTANSFLRFALFLRYAIEGEVGKMDELTNGDFGKTLETDTQLAAFAGSVYALAGMKDKALHWVEHAIDGGFTNYPWLAEIDPFLSQLRGDPRFEALLERARHEWEAMKTGAS